MPLKQPGSYKVQCLAKNFNEEKFSLQVFFWGLCLSFPERARYHAQSGSKFMLHVVTFFLKKSPSVRIDIKSGRLTEDFHTATD